LLACSSTDSGSLQITFGEETNVFTEAPAPTTLTVYAIDSSNNATTLGTGPVSTSDIDLGDQDESSAASIMVLGTTASGTDVVAGTTLGLEYGALSGGTLPVFVQRTNEWARPPNPPSDARQSPTLAVVSGEFLFIGGGTNGNGAGDAGGPLTSIDLYDFAALGPVANAPTMPFAPESMPVVGTVALLLAHGAAAYYDFSQDITAVVQPLASANGFTFDDVAGGQVLYDYDNTSGTLDAVFVVGATRAQGTPTQAVLEIDATDTSNSNYPSGNLHWFALTTPRLGAAAAWTGTALVVVGGNASSSGYGAEQLVPSANNASFQALEQFPFDPSSGEGGAALSTGSVLVAGGITPTGQDAGVRLYDLTCTTPSSGGMVPCITPWATLPVALTGASTFVLGSTLTVPAVVIGNEPDSGLTHTFLLTETSATPLATKVPHYNAAAIQSPLGFGSVVLYGGANEIESLFPPQSSH
jgi:hypothetical protein